MSSEILMRVGQFMLVAAVAFAVGTFFGREHPSDRAVGKRLEPAMREFNRALDQFTATPTPSP